MVVELSLTQNRHIGTAYVHNIVCGPNLIRPLMAHPILSTAMRSHIRIKITTVVDRMGQMILLTVLKDVMVLAKNALLEPRWESVGIRVLKTNQNVILNNRHCHQSSLNILGKKSDHNWLLMTLAMIRCTIVMIKYEGS